MIKLERTTIYTVKEIAEMMGKSQDLVRRMIASGTLKGQKVGRSWYVTDEALMEVFAGKTRRTPRKE